MTTRSPSDFDFDRTIDAWLALGPTELSDRVVESASAEVHRTRQRGARWADLGRRPRPRAWLIQSLGVAATVVILVGVALRLSSPPKIGAGPAPSHTARPTLHAFQPTGSMSTGRLDHTATLLADGRVLIEGGSGWVEDGRLETSAPIITETAELYDPATGTFSPTGSMTAARAHHTATLLLDGRVLIIGGGVSGAEADVDPGAKGYVLASAEIYDPRTGAFTATGSMSVGLWASAIRLADGRVLVVGEPFDTTNTHGIATAEIYDPRTGQFTPAGFASGPTFNPLELLGDGRVLGTSPYEHPQPIQIYDPSTPGVIEPANLPDGYYDATALADGRVLFIGGVPQGGAGAVAETLVAQLYDPATGVLSPTGSPGIDFQALTTTLLADGRVLMVGFTGRADSDRPSAAVIYDPMTGAFEVVADALITPDPRGLPGGHVRALQGRTATLLLDGRVLLVGGGLDEGRTPAFNVAELFK
jgi:hypothetical protein